MNARELYHFSRLRQDGHAQWEIRGIANRMVEVAKRFCPLTMSLACGKDAFEQRKTVMLEKST
jgi:thymidylate synthase ThyX